MIRVGVAGYGYWGPNLVRNFTELPRCEVVAVSDLAPARLVAAKRRFPTVETTTSFRDLISNPRIDAIAIATPVSTHFDLATLALREGKHVLLEKPMAASSEQGLRLIEEAERRRRTLMVDHTFVFSGAVRKIRELINDESFGDVYYYDSVRVNLGIFQHDVNVIWDLAVHDLSIMDYVLEAQPCAVSATGMTPLLGSTESIAFLTTFFDGDMIGHVNVNWLAPVKVRQTLIGGSQRMILYDDLQPSEKVKVYHKGVTVDHERSPESIHRLLVGYRTGDMWAPKLAQTEALQAAVAHFIDCVEAGRPPITDGHAGLRVVRLLEAATKSMRNRGRLVPLLEPGVLA
jgi:predicted dehydrogenase